jgi:HEAT repeat protein
MDIESAQRILQTGSTAERSRVLAWIRDAPQAEEVASTIGPLVARCLVHSDSLIRAEAVETLGTPAFSAWHPALITMLTDDADATVRACCAEALGDAGSRLGLPALRRAISDVDAAVRGYAAASLGLIGEPVDVALVRHHAELEQTSSRFDFLAALCRLDDRADSVESLLQALDQVDEEDAFRALNVIQDLLSRRIPQSFLALRSRLSHTLTTLQLRLGQPHQGQLSHLAKLALNAG